MRQRLTIRNNARRLAAETFVRTTATPDVGAAGTVVCSKKTPVDWAVVTVVYATTTPDVCVAATVVCTTTIPDVCATATPKADATHSSSHFSQSTFQRKAEKLHAAALAAIAQNLQRQLETKVSQHEEARLEQDQQLAIARVKQDRLRVAHRLKIGENGKPTKKQLCGIRMNVKIELRFASCALPNVQNR